jgi:NAD(P)-dependent dehydrogenase (short-subunit alcohol dehydrogenase family)
MIELVSQAEQYVVERATTRPSWTRTVTRRDRAATRDARARLRYAISEAAGRPMIVSSHTDDEVTAFVALDDLASLSQRGTVTPDHVIRTKPWPMLGRDVDDFVSSYERYFDENQARTDAALQRLDPAPRVVLDAELGMACVGRTARDARIAEDIYRHTMKVILDATALGGYQPVSLPDLFDVEYWDLEQAKLRRQGAPPSLAGEVALVTGAASGIGRACAAALLAEGAAVVGLDLASDVESVFEGPAWLGLTADVTDGGAVEDALELGVERFGGLDVLVLNAGVFPPGAPLAELTDDAWRSVMGVNLDANLALLRRCHPLLRVAPRGGRVVVIGSKNVPAPGPGVAAYSASKAALTQLARVAALEWGGDGIRVNVIHPNAVFDTGVWNDDVLAQRAAQYGLSVEEYRTNNLLHVEVTSADVARLCVTMCGPAFAKTTGAQVPLDGGNDRVV